MDPRASKATVRCAPLGIPVIVDRCLQAVEVNALEPEWEARFEPKSYGFRPGRGCHDAFVAIHTTVSRTDANRLCDSTPIWRRHVTGSTTTTSTSRWARSPHGAWYFSG